MDGRSDWHRDAVLNKRWRRPTLEPRDAIFRMTHERGQNRSKGNIESETIASSKVRSRGRFTCSLCSLRASVSRSKRIPHSRRSRTPGDSLARCCTLDSADRSCRRSLRRSDHTFFRSRSPRRFFFRRHRCCRHRRHPPHRRPAPPHPAPSLSDSAARSLRPPTFRSRNYYFAERSFDATPSGAAVDYCRGWTSISSKTVVAAVVLVWSKGDPPVPDGSCVSRTRRI